MKAIEAHNVMYTATIGQHRISANSEERLLELIKAITTPRKYNKPKKTKHGRTRKHQNGARQEV